MKTRATRQITDKYFELVRRFPLRRIRDDESHAEATRITRELLLRGEDNLDAGELDYLDALAGFIESYERTLVRMNKPSPLQVLTHLMEASGMKPADLGRLIGSSAASMVLHAQRELSKSHIRKLADHFHVDPALFL